MRSGVPARRRLEPSGLSGQERLSTGSGCNLSAAVKKHSLSLSFILSGYQFAIIVSSEHQIPVLESSRLINSERLLSVHEYGIKNQIELTPVESKPTHDHQVNLVR